MIWKPNVTVAAIIEQDGRFLLVEERAGGALMLNQPAGHLEPHESLLQAVARETLEESAYHFSPEALVGMYQWHSVQKGVTYLRFAFTGSITGHDPHRALDKGIVQAAWFTQEAILAEAARHRSPMVLHCIEDYLAGKRYPLELLMHYD